MVVMDEAVVVMMIFGLWALAAYGLYQRFFVNRRLRKRLEKYAEAMLDAGRLPSATVSQDSQTEDGMKRIQRRLEVLERIAVEKEDSLTREIEELRIASR